MHEVKKNKNFLFKYKQPIVLSKKQEVRCHGHMDVLNSIMGETVNRHKYEFYTVTM